MNGIVYVRVSSKEQVAGTSLESQEFACREYAGRNNVTVLRVFVERGESAKFADRTQLLELFDFCRERQNAVQVLLVWKVDRLARNVGDHFNIKARLLKEGIRVISVTEPIDSKPEGKLLETILAGFAQFDNDLRATRTVQGMRRKIQEGIFPFKPPLGYKTINQRGSKKTAPDQPDEPTFSLLRRAWNEFATGAYTQAEILRMMWHWNLRTAGGKPVPKQTLNDILHDPFYAGIIRDPWSGEDHPGRHLPMVSPEVFAKVQEVTRLRNRSPRHQSIRPEFPLRMFARCSACSHYVTGSLSRGRSRHYPYYHCFNHSCEERINHATEMVHGEFEGFLNAITPDREDLQDLGHYVMRLIRERAKTGAVVAEKRGLELKRIAEQQLRLVEMRASDEITVEEFTAHRELLRDRQMSLQATRANRNYDEVRIESQIETICEPLSRLPETWKEMDPTVKQRFQRMILPNGFLIGGIGTAQMGCLFWTFVSSEREKSGIVAQDGQFWNQLMEDIQQFANVFTKNYSEPAA